MSAPELRAFERRASTAYELAMLRVGLLRAALVSALVAGLSLLGVTAPAPALLLATAFAATCAVGWRGGLWWRGALGGLAVGLAGLALPVSVLRACCRPGAMQGATCSMPQVCLAAGAVLGAAVAASLPSTKTTGDAARASVGAMVGVVLLLACRCEGMLVGESVGLLGGLLASAAGLAAVRAWWNGRAGA